MNFQILFSGENKKNIPSCRLLKFFKRSNRRSESTLSYVRMRVHVSGMSILVSVNV